MTQFNFDIFNTKKNADQGAWLHIKHPVTDEPCYIDEGKTKPIRIKLRGDASTVSLKKMESDYNRIRAEQAKKSDKSEIEDISIDDNIRKEAEKLAILVIAWENIYHDDKVLEFNYKNSVLLFEVYLEIKIQAESFVKNKINFIKG